MSDRLFNFHDLILLMTAVVCGFFALIIFSNGDQKNKSHIYLGLFLLSHALIPLHELMLWGELFNQTLLKNHPNIYFIGGFSYYVDAVFIYFYLKSLAFSDLRLRPKDAVHCLPLLIYVIYILNVFYFHSSAEKLALIASREVLYAPSFTYMEVAGKSVRLVYCAYCLALVSRYQDRLMDTYSTIDRQSLRWLMYAVMAVSVLMFVEFLLSLLKAVNTFVVVPYQVFMPLGLSGYYGKFIFLMFLVFTSLKYLSGLASVKQQKPAKDVPQKIEFDQGLVEKIKLTMQEKKPYLRSDLSFDILSESLEIPTYELSTTINTLFDMNFYAFVNGYRIDEAMRMLENSEFAKKTITDIYLDVGFNSKSVFYTFFKSRTGMTPVEYRKSFAAS